ncbi:MAG: DUF692 family protein [Planctomycetota bacterium]
MSVAIGYSLQPEERTLELTRGLLESEPDYYVIAPETTWRPAGDGNFEPNGFSRYFRELGDRTGKPFVAHGVGFSLGNLRPDAERRSRWLHSIARDQATFDFLWYTDHLGLTVLDGLEVLLPLGLPYTDEAAAAVRDSLTALQTVVPHVGFENSVFYFHLGEPLEEPAWIARCLEGSHRHLLLDVHNVYTTAVNAGFNPRTYIERLPLDKVIEIHVSGGSFSDPAWLRSGNVLRLDSHDQGVPDEVWELLQFALPRCPKLRGVTLERLEGTIEPDDVPRLVDELQRIRRILGRRHVR